MKKIKHPHRTGYHLIFENGHTYSVVNLGESPDGKVNPIEPTLWKTTGELYDKMGGRYEGILIPTDDYDWGEPIRAHSFNDVINKIKQFYFYINEKFIKNK